MLRRHAIIDVDDLDANLVANASAPSCLGFKASKDPSTWYVSVYDRLRTI
jgi:hypothetical protein